MEETKYSVSLKFSKREKLKSRKAIQHLFQQRQSFHVFPLRVIWASLEPMLSESPVQFAVSVSKRSFPKAVQRNRIKRIIREVYRLNKNTLYRKLRENKGQIGIMLLYTGKKEPSFESVEKAMKKINGILPKKIKKHA